MTWIRDVGLFMKPNLRDVTLICIDCTGKEHLAERAIAKSLEQCDFGAVKLLTDKPGRKWGVQIPPVRNVEEYSGFVVRKLWKYVETSHCLIVQWDGYVVNGSAWDNEFLNCDYIG